MCSTLWQKSALTKYFSPIGAAAEVIHEIWQNIYPKTHFFLSTSQQKIQGISAITHTLLQSQMNRDFSLIAQSQHISGLLFGHL